MNLKSVAAVGLGGALGAILRYALSLMPYKGDFPLPTFIANLVGALAIGFIAGITQGHSKNIVLFFKTGVCGGFTTFSTFSLETVTLFEKGKYFIGTAYVISSLAVCLLGVFAGMEAGKRIFS
jgi:CrcB protein